MRGVCCAVLTIIALSAAGAGQGAAPTTLPIRLTAALSRHAVFPFEPVMVGCSETADGTERVRITLGATVRVRAVGQARDKSTGYPLTDKDVCGYADPSFLKHGESHYSVLVCGFGNTVAFSESGEYLIRCGFVEDRQAELRLRVERPPREEQECVNYIASKPEARAYTEYILREYLRIQKDFNGADPSTALGEVIRRFPRTRYAEWSKLALLIEQKIKIEVRLGKFHELAGKAASQEVLLLKEDLKRLDEELADLAYASDYPPVSAECLFEAGAVALMRNDGDEAEKWLSKAIRCKGSDVMEQQVQELKQLSTAGKLKSLPSTSETNP